MNAFATLPEQRRSVLVDMATRYGMEPAAFEATVRATCMPSSKGAVVQATREEFAAFLLVAREYHLNPITREIYAFPRKGGGIVPIVSVDGWVTLVNSHPACDGFEFEDHHDDNGGLVSCTCRMYRKDRGRPVSITEYLSECIRDTDPWRMKHRMLRHKAMIQAARYAFGFSGIYDEDEGRDQAELRDVTPGRSGPPPAPPAQITETAPAGVLPPTSTAGAQDAGGPAPSALVGAESAPASANSEPQDAEWFDVKACLEELGNQLATARTPADLAEVEALYAEDLERLRDEDAETAQGLIAAARERVAAKPAEEPQDRRDQGEAVKEPATAETPPAAAPEPANAGGAPAPDVTKRPDTWAEYYALAEHVLANMPPAEARGWWMDTATWRDPRPGTDPFGPMEPPTPTTDPGRQALRAQFTALRKGGAS